MATKWETFEVENKVRTTESIKDVMEAVNDTKTSNQTILKISNELQEEIKKIGANIKEKIEKEEAVAKEEREKLFNNTNEVGQKAMNSIQITGEKIVQVLGSTIQEEGKKMHGTFPIVGEMLNDKMNQRIGQLENKVQQNQIGENLKQIMNESMQMNNELIMNSKNELLNGIYNINLNVGEILNRVNIEMENAKEERRVLNGNLGHTHMELTKESEINFELMKEQIGSCLLSNNEAIIRAGNDGVNKIREVINIQNEQGKMSLDIQGEVRNIMEKIGMTLEEVKNELHKRASDTLENNNMDEIKKWLVDNYSKLEVGIKDLKITIYEEKKEKKAKLNKVEEIWT
jgi:hypothetical protein